MKATPIPITMTPPPKIVPAVATRPARVLIDAEPKPRRIPPPKRPPLPTCEAVLDAVCEVTGYSREIIDDTSPDGSFRTGSVVAARRAFAWLCRHCIVPTPTYPEIAATIARGRGHTSSLASVTNYAHTPAASDVAKRAAELLRGKVWFVPKALDDAHLGTVAQGEERGVGAGAVHRRGREDDA